jgi:hypothetical protein
MGRISPAFLGILAGAVLVAVLTAGWFALVAPKRAEAADLGRQIDATRVLLAAAPEEQPVAKAEAQAEAQVERLAVAVPKVAEMPAIVIELNRIAERAMVRLDQIAPQSPVPHSGYQMQSITVTLKGTFFAVSDFVRLLRAEATLADGGLVAGEGRIYSVESVTFTEGEEKYPVLTAVATISTVFGAVPVVLADDDPEGAQVPGAPEGDVTDAAGGGS